jgi:hypothetical protein
MGKDENSKKKYTWVKDCESSCNVSAVAQKNWIDKITKHY